MEDNMPSTISGLLVILFVVLPGIPGNSIYQRIVGTDRKEEQWSAIVRIVGFSVGGLILYVLLGTFVNVPLPTYVSPATFTNFTADRTVLLNMSWAFSGHVVGSVLVSLAIARIELMVNRWTRSTSYPDTWDKFTAEYVANHWVVVSLSNEKIYAGILARANVSVDSDERDIILKEPAEYVVSQRNYTALPYQYLFIPGSQIATVGVVSNTEDSRVTTIGTPIFPTASKKSKKQEKRR